MRPDALTPEQEAFLDKEGYALREMMGSDGWKILSRLFAETVASYDTTKGIRTVKELYARQDAIAMMNAWMEAIVRRTERLRHKESVKAQVKERMASSGLVRMEEVGEDEES